MARVLVIGSGGREHALAWKLSQSPLVDEILVAPGNDGMRDVAKLLDANDLTSWVAAAIEYDVDLVVVGPEVPLVDGLADRLREAGRVVFGPGAEAAQIEGDKQWAKELMNAAGVPTAMSGHFDELDAALAHLKTLDGPCVIKATGLAAGKGVTVCDDAAQAESAIRDCLENSVFGAAGSSVLIEERMFGPELSVFAVVDGERYAWFAPSRDHKRLGEGDAGPNTGGMGAYTLVADADSKLMGRIESEIIEPTIAELRRRGLDFRGLLYVGIMITTEGPKVVEYNCRFGDPETQVVLPTFDGDLYELLHSAAIGRLNAVGALPSKQTAVGVVLASAGYPASSQKGVEIPGLLGLELGEAEQVFHAATILDGGRWMTNGGRVLCAVAGGGDFPTARSRAHQLAEQLEFDGAQYRRDIAQQEDR